MRVKTVLLFLVGCLVVVPIIGCSSEEMSLEYRLMVACGDGDVDAVNDLLDQGAGANGGEALKGLPLFFALGAYDTVALVEMPDNVSATAFSMAAAAAGGVKAVKTTPLMTTEEGITAMKKAADCGYRPPS